MHSWGPEEGHSRPEAEADLVQRARGGDHQAWEALYRSVYPRLRSYLGRRVEPDHAEDAVSETMARAVAGLERFELGPAGFSGWVFGIARRVAADHHRGRSRFFRQHDAAVRSMASPDGAPPGETMMLHEEHAALRRHFSRLSPGEQEILELRVVAGLSAEAVAEVLGKKPGAVRTAQSRALAHLRRLVEESTR
jgi:RNA polymerase sigma-70 factor (ECF subfamily)